MVVVMRVGGVRVMNSSIQEHGESAELFRQSIALCHVLSERIFRVKTS